MSTVNPRAITLSQTSAFGSKKQELTAPQIGIRYKRDPETKQAPTEIDGYNLNVLSPRTGEVQTVKLPSAVADKYDAIQSALKSNQTVVVSFNGTFKAKFWAMLGDNGRVNMGISATASELEVIRIESIADDDFMDEEIIM